MGDFIFSGMQIGTPWSALIIFSNPAKSITA